MIKYTFFYVLYISLVCFKLFKEASFLDKLYGIDQLVFDNTNDYALVSKIDGIRSNTFLLLFLLTIILFLFSLIKYIHHRKTEYLIGIIIYSTVLLIFVLGTIPFFNGIL